MGGSTKLGARLLCGAAAAAILASAGLAQAEERAVRFEIPAQPLTAALNEFGIQSGSAVLFKADVTGARLSRPLSGAVEPERALTAMLDGTGLSYRRDGDAFVIVQGGSGDPQPASAAEGATVEALIVTAQKKEEDIQDVPIAISAFSQKTLEAMKVEGGFDLLKAIPNVTFSKNNFTGFNFSIRGVGTKAISATTDPGVSVSFNNTGLIQNRLFEQEYFDVERVEVLRGPQGTLYGRNATSGVINVISAKPNLTEFDGWIKGEVGNYENKRVSAMVNVPLVEDVLAVRVAGALTNRQGYDLNTITGNAVNGRELWSARVTIGFEPTERLRGNFIWERFEEDDNRSRTGKQLCHRDPGPDYVGDEFLPDGAEGFGGDPVELQADIEVRRSVFSQGCKPGNLYDAAAFGTPNGLSYNFILGALALRRSGIPIVSTALGYYNIGLFPSVLSSGQTFIQPRDPYRGLTQSRDLRKIASIRDPVYRAGADLLELSFDYDVTPSLTFSSQTVYVEDSTYSFQDFNRFNTQPIFTDTSGLEVWNNDDYGALAPGGIFCDPQLGCSDRMVGFDIAKADAEQFSQEFRLQSAFDGPFNFSLGSNYTKFETEIDYYVMFNVLTALAWSRPLNLAVGEFDPNNPVCGNSDYFLGVFTSSVPVSTSDPNSACPYVDPNPIESIDGEGHNYFRSRNPYELESWSVFGESYWEVADAVRVTAGLRYTNDTKVFTPVPTQTLLSPSWISGGTVAKGYPEKPPIKQKWGELTGRLGVDWKPDLAFTDQTMLYAFYSRGYKGGGANPPRPGFATEDEIVAILQAQEMPQWAIDESVAIGLWPVLKLSAAEYGETFEPEFVDAFEVGAKNTLLGGAMTVNATAFYYDYKDYQVSQIRDRTAVNENFDATTWGLELETMFAPSRNLLIIANLGYLDTKIADGERSINIMDRTQGNPYYIVAKPWIQLPSNCVVPVHVAEEWARTHMNAHDYFNFCGVSGGPKVFGSLPPTDEVTGLPYDPATYPEINDGAGIFEYVGGNELPNAPHWTTNIGAQYSFDLPQEWRLTVRGDAYWQSQSWHRVYNDNPYDKLHGWYNANLSMWAENEDLGLKVEFYVKNLLNKTPITDAFLNSDDTGLTTNVFVLDPRVYGLSLRKEF